MGSSSRTSSISNGPKKEELQAKVAELQAQLDSTSTEAKALVTVISSVSGKKKTGLTYALDHNV